ncbi:hypothetical protein DFH07DRAFT_1016525 [Mycena maculata]|uniref:Uncharacterized protein n=1 Tax=Mycena maculata TaxID=230809 RepID=A0AAD7H8D9_9AGAR|nr:hypothetical protein DFH07DRAFT_1016525 [Mycena maculata]
MSKTVKNGTRTRRGAKNQPGSSRIRFHPILPIVPFRSRHSGTSRRVSFLPMSAPLPEFDTLSGEAPPPERVWKINSTHQYLVREDRKIFLQTDVADQSVTVYSPHQIHLYIKYDRILRSENPTATRKVPGGYQLFASNYHAEGLPEAFAWVNTDGVLMGSDRKVVDRSTFEIDVRSIYTIRDLEDWVDPEYRIMTTAEGKAYDRMVLIFAQRNLAFEDRIAKREAGTKRTREDEPGEVREPEAVLKKLKFSKNKPAEGSSGKGKGKELTEEQIAAKKEKKKAKKAKKAQGDSAEMEVDD